MTVTALIGIVSWNTADLLDRCLASISAAAEGLDYRVVVQDNGSTDSSARVARAHPGVEVRVAPRNEGYARAMNAALETPVGETPPDILIALNPDTVCPPGSLRALAEALLADPGAGLVAPALRYPGGGHQPSAYRFPSPAVAAAASFLPLRLQRGRLGHRFGLEAATPPDRPVDVDWVTGAVHVIRREALRGRTPYNERWFMYTEDLDLCWRLAQYGWRSRLVPSITVTHVANAAGRLAWGPGRTERWLEATYDWYVLRHGPRAARRWAAVNTLGASFRLAQVGWRNRRASGSGRGGGGERPAWQDELAPALAVHRRVLRSPARLRAPGQFP